ncbi:MAG: hypothetical protein OJF48_001032 [Afipia sp.]|nr:MAG: hypothetical protein OJF48_001032 [Afipia sp.]
MRIVGFHAVHHRHVLAAAARPHTHLLVNMAGLSAMGSPAAADFPHMPP